MKVKSSNLLIANDKKTYLSVSLLVISQRILQAASIPLLLLVLTRRLGEAQAGYFFAMNGLAGAQTIFEMGFGTQVLHWVNHLQSLNARAELSAFKIMSNKISAIQSIVFSIFIGAAGYFTLMRNQSQLDNVDWQIPWLFVVASNAVALAMVSKQSFLEGLGHVTEVAVIRFLNSIIAPGTLLVGFLLGLELNAMVCSSTANVLCLYGGTRYLERKYTQREALDSSEEIRVGISYKNDIMPTQVRQLGNWIAGYATLQLMVPITLSMKGPVQAAHLGLVLAFTNGIVTLASAWITSATPIISRRVASKETRHLRPMLTLVGSLSIISAIAGVTIAFLLLKTYHLSGMASFWNTFDPVSVLCLLSISVLSTVAFLLASLLRVQRREPFVKTTVVTAVLSVLLQYTALSRYELKETAIALFGLLAGGTVVMTVGFRKEIRKSIAAT